ncbi:prephenate dehydrogenase [Bacillus sp. B1-b2]|uniref:prephenate dehydrogenase n=1 Tax=Bacillus sp. B1-b2 TaxID=2653201 RepID=UPI001261B257|nr:prephenate dehydrogenase [Bacillus sp. B1-b2]KAB7672935.1 prephenate dehydrogenase [Bacillus sp. B1-b2]
MNGRVFIIGLGLIGGSLALCIKKEHPNSSIIGFDISQENLKLGTMLGVIDEIATSIEAGVENADLIILSTPVKETELIIESLTRLDLKENVIITDVGSTKTVITNKSEALLAKGITFIGGHPMAGSHKSGVSASKSILFENAFYLLTPHVSIDSKKVNQLQDWLIGTNAKFIVISPEEHDLLTGVISHLPHIVAASLVHQADHTSESHELVTRLAAGGFRDITRIASSSPAMWRDILIHNKEVLKEQLVIWKKEMDSVYSLIETEDEEGIFNYFHRAKEVRDGLPLGQKGAIPAFYDLYVDVPDYPGVISEITGYLAQENISITNIRILETREEIFGILVISFQTEEDRKRAQNCIASYSNYDSTIG